MPGGSSAGTATVISSLPYTDSDTSPNSAGLWYAYTAGAPPPNELGIFLYSAANVKLSLYSPDDLTLYPPNNSIDQVLNLPVQVPVDASTTYYLRAHVNAGAYTINVQAAPNSTAAAGSLLVNDDTVDYPLAVLSAVDGSVLQFRHPVACSDFGMILDDGTTLFWDDTDDRLRLYDQDFVALATLTPSPAASVMRVSSNKTDTFYVGHPTGSGAAYATTVTTAGAFGPTTWTFPTTGLVSLAPSPDETILYFMGQSSTVNAPILRWDLVNDLPLSDLDPGVVGFTPGKDLIVLSDGTVLSAYKANAGAANIRVRRYQTDGTVLNTYLFATAKGNDTRLARALDDPVSFWVWLKISFAGGTKSRFQNIRASDGTALTTFDAIQFNAGVEEDAVSATPSVRFGHSDSCPLLIAPIELPPVTAPITPITGTVAITAPGPTSSSLPSGSALSVTGYILPPRHVEALCEAVMSYAALAPDARQRILNALGALSPGCLLYSYESGTTTPLVLYSDSALTVALPNPVVADSSGLLPALYLLPQAYSFVLRNSVGELIWAADPVQDVGALIQSTLTTLQATVAANLALTETKFCTTQFNAVTGTTGATLTNIVGLTGFTLAAAGVYKFDINISGVSTANCGLKLGFKYTTATLTNLESEAQGFTAAAVAVQHSTSTTDQATLFGQTAAVIGVRIAGRITVNVAGTLALQAAQNAAHVDTTSVYIGSWATFVKVS